MASVAPTAAASRSIAASPRERRTCRASVMRATSPSVPALAKRMHQGRLRRTNPRLVFSGWPRSRSIPGTLRSRPGTDFGVTSEVAMRPALPNEQASPGASRSMSTTSKPRSCSRRAHAAPTMPATDDDGAPAVRENCSWGNTPSPAIGPTFHHLTATDAELAASLHDSVKIWRQVGPLVERRMPARCTAHGAWCRTSLGVGWVECGAAVRFAASRIIPRALAVSRVPRRAPRGGVPSAAGGRCCRGTRARCARRGRR